MTNHQKRCLCGFGMCGAIDKKTGKCFHQVSGDIYDKNTKMVCVHCGNKIIVCHTRNKIPFLRIKA